MFRCIISFSLRLQHYVGPCLTHGGRLRLNDIVFHCGDLGENRFDVVVGSYPGRGDTPGRVKVSGTDPHAVTEATAWLRERVDVVDDEA